MDSTGQDGEKDDREEDSRQEEAAKRQSIDTGTNTRFVRRRAAGKFKESDDLSTSLSADRWTKAATKVKRGHGDTGDR